MAVSAQWYNRGLKNVLDGTVHLLTDTLKVALLLNTYVKDKDHNVWADVSTHEVAAGGGYVAGGATLANPAISEDDANDMAILDADDVSWNPSTITARFAVIYDTTVSGSPLIALVDFGEDMASSNNEFKIEWALASAGGVLKLGHAA